MPRRRCTLFCSRSFLYEPGWKESLVGTSAGFARRLSPSKERTIGADEFEKTAVQDLSDGALIVDMRPFNDRQAEAMDFYLNEITARIKTGRSCAPTIVIWCDRGTLFYYSTLDCYRALWRARVRVTIEEKRRPETPPTHGEVGHSTYFDDKPVYRC